ncbi:hypothetical protein [Corynebacterium sp. HMSC034H07]|uniref:hypothetical protein n=1 Tax=Corynebacterium sp. HMSC034H07 TaxID=1739512 RepID=UPI0008A24D76|nr:hypothetical protein [Corynebacterium sp. HMSC034H07]OFO96732.1 hypothetical protein HMPREF3009_05300 [Corynebacterium sp. HMSC034H07]
MAKKDQPQQGVAEQLQPLVDDDAFLTTLSEGTDPSDGGDELAELLLELRGDVEKQMPPAPLIEGADEEPEVISLDAARRRRRGKPFIHGLIGAAAATLLIAGSGAVVVNAGPGSPLYGVNQSLFGTNNEDVSVVELAGTLDEMEKRSAQGDMDGTRQLLEEARKMVDQAKREREAEAPRTTRQQPRATVTQTQTVEKPVPVEEEQPPQEPATVTQTQTAVSTVVVTQTVSAGNPLNPPAPTYPEPSQPGGGEQPTPPQGDNSDGDGTGDNGQLPPPQFQQ